MIGEVKTADEALEELEKEFTELRDWGWAEGKWKREDGRRNDPAAARNAECYLECLALIKERLRVLEANK